MLKRFCMAASVACVLIPQVAVAADLPRVRVHRHITRVVHRVPPSRYFSCTTTNFFLFSASRCTGGGFDPLSVAGV